MTIELSNVGERTGTEVVQVYTGKSAAPVDAAERELVGFDRVSLESVESTTVTVSLEREGFAYYDEDDGWTVADKTNTVAVGRLAWDLVRLLEVEV
ncbi:MULTISPECIES: fibronectin type III-like domain-contianing protein [Natrialbaceae]|uniref:fibronectin type III-like domain-contianing protein n=1 Tax=Natrialbaceae TaxID=1644061 RepID=UPI00207D637C|nr:fibronectin type III-like domain-contianing protein [Natronococcus sp. CG52]